MNKVTLKRILCCISLIVLNLGCSESKSPDFAPGTVVGISGKYLDESGRPFSDRVVYFQNVRQFGYVDENEVATANVLLNLAYFTSAYPFYRFYDDPFKRDPLTVDRSQFTKRANYMFENVRTNGAGEFSFKIKAEQMLRDEQGGINIVIVNEKAEEPLFGKYVFVVKSADTNLGTLQFCTLGGIQVVEDGVQDTVTFSWNAPSDSVKRYVLRFGLVDTGNAIWNEVVDGNVTSATFPRSLFMNQKVRLAIEGFFSFESEKKISCLSSPIDFQLNSPTLSFGEQATASAENIKFKFDTLTNKKFADASFFEAFSERSFVVDLKQSSLVSRIVLYNLRLYAGGQGNVLASDDGVNFTEVGSFQEKRFLSYTLPVATNARYLKFQFSARLIDLQEIGIF